MSSMLIRQIYEELKGMGIGDDDVDVNGGDSVDYLNQLKERLEVAIVTPETGTWIQECNFTKVVRTLRTINKDPVGARFPIYFSARLLFVVSMGEEGNMIRLKQNSDSSFWIDMTKDELTDCLDVEDWVIFNNYCPGFFRYNKASKAPATPKLPREFS